MDNRPNVEEDEHSTEDGEWFFRGLRLLIVFDCELHDWNNSLDPIHFRVEF